MKLTLPNSSEFQLVDIPGIIVHMDYLIAKLERTNIHQTLKSVVLIILTMPLVTVFAWALFICWLANLFGLPGIDLAKDFIEQVAGPVALMQAKMLLVVASIGALFLFASWYRIGILIHYLAGELNSNISDLLNLWSSVLSVVLTALCLPTIPGLRFEYIDGILRPSVRFIPGETPQLE